MPRKLLFLLGGSAAFEAVMADFVSSAGGREASLALLMQGGPNWEKYLPQYVVPWTRLGATRCQPIVPGADGELNLEEASKKLGEATGIFIGGGHTPTYHRLYATEPIRSLLHERYQAGVPIAGVSAGALIAVEDCVLDAEELGEDALRIVPGLGLARGLVMEVHFTEQSRLSNLLESMVTLGAGTGWGIDEAACLVVEDGELTRVLGRSVYKVEMTDFETQDYKIAEWPTESRKG